VPFIRSQNVRFEGLSLDDVVFINEDTHDEMQSSAVLPNDVLFNITGASIGRCCKVPAQFSGAANVNQHVCIVRPTRAVSTAYLTYVLSSPVGQTQMALSQDGISREGLSFERLAQFTIPLPPLETQRRIASYLDRETAEIDRLIAAKERLLTLLAEKRRALITHAVTKGIYQKFEPDLLHEGHSQVLSNGWEFVQLERVAQIIDCKHKTVPFVLAGIPLASIREVQSWEVDLTNAKMTTEDEYLSMIEGDRDPREGDIIISRNATVGETALVKKETHFCMGQDVALIRPNYRLQSQFANWVFRSDFVREQVKIASVGATFFRINVDQIRSLTVPLPPVALQRDISLFLSTRLNQYAKVESKTQASVEMLRERRSVLIAAAVTGELSI